MAVVETSFSSPTNNNSSKIFNLLQNNNVTGIYTIINDCNNDEIKKILKLDFKISESNTTNTLNILEKLLTYKNKSEIDQLIKIIIEKVIKSKLDELKEILSGLLNKLYIKTGDNVKNLLYFGKDLCFGSLLYNNCYNSILYLFKTIKEDIENNNQTKLKFRIPDQFINILLYHLIFIDNENYKDSELMYIIKECYYYKNIILKLNFELVLKLLYICDDINIGRSDQFFNNNLLNNNNSFKEFVSDDDSLDYKYYKNKISNYDNLKIIDETYKNNLFKTGSDLRQFNKHIKGFINTQLLANLLILYKHYDISINNTNSTIKPSKGSKGRNRSKLRNFFRFGKIFRRTKKRTAPHQTTIRNNPDNNFSSQLEYEEPQMGIKYLPSNGKNEVIHPKTPQTINWGYKDETLANTQFGGYFRKHNKQTRKKSNFLYPLTE